MTIEERNQQNAQHSTGPRTEEGKAKSSLNNLRHGVFATTQLIPGEDPEAYDLYCRTMIKAFHPLDGAEMALVVELTDTQWRLRRASRYEAKIMSSETPDNKAINTMSLHSSRLKRQYSQALKEFRILHRENVDSRRAQLPDAFAVYRADESKQRPSTL